MAFTLENACNELRPACNDDDAVKEEIVDAAGDDNTVVVVVGELISPSFFFPQA